MEGLYEIIVRGFNESPNNYIEVTNIKGKANETIIMGLRNAIARLKLEDKVVVHHENARVFLAKSNVLVVTPSTS